MDTGYTALPGFVQELVARHCRSGGIESGQLGASVGAGEAPVDAHTGAVAAVLPGIGLVLEAGGILDASAKAVGPQGCQFECGHVEPTAMLRGVVELKLAAMRRASSGAKAS